MKTRIWILLALLILPLVPTVAAEHFPTWCDGVIPLVVCNVDGAADHGEEAFRKVVPEGDWCYIPFEGYNRCW